MNNDHGAHDEPREKNYMPDFESPENPDNVEDEHEDSVRPSEARCEAGPELSARTSLAYG